MVDGACKISSINQSLVPLLCVVVVAVVVVAVVVVVVVVLVVALESPFKERVLRCWTGRGGPGGWALPLPLPSGGHHRPCCPFVLCLHVCLGLPSAAGCLRRRRCCCSGWSWFRCFFGLLCVACLPPRSHGSGFTSVASLRVGAPI